MATFLFTIIEEPVANLSISVAHFSILVTHLAVLNYLLCRVFMSNGVLKVYVIECKIWIIAMCIC